MLQGRNARECHSELVDAVGNNALLYRTVMRLFQRGCATSGDLKCSGQLVSVRNDVSRAVTDQCIESDRRWTLLSYKQKQPHCGIL
jgi:hypothetical protein